VAERGLRFSRASATVRLVCAGWKAVYDTLVRRLVLRRKTTDEAMGMMVRRFPAVVSLELKREYLAEEVALSDEGLRAVSSLPALTSLDLRECCKVTAAGVQALRSTTVALACTSSSASSAAAWKPSIVLYWTPSRFKLHVLTTPCSTRMHAQPQVGCG
jgi:hypothetical protein